MAFVITSAFLAGFGDELKKIADHHVHTSIEDIRKDLKPGDILVTKPTDEFMKGKYVQKTLRALLKKFQGSDFTHSSLYAGNDKIIDSGMWKGQGSGVRTIPLKDYGDRYHFRVLRVNASPSERKDAVQYAEDQVGKPFSLTGMMRLALPVQKSRVKRERQVLDKLFCSELVANAYPNQNFAAHRKIQHVRPVDIQRSPLTRIVSEFGIKE